MYSSGTVDCGGAEAEGFFRAELRQAVQVDEMDAGCLLAAQGEGVMGEDYQVFLSDGRALGQVWVLQGCRDPAAEGKRRALSMSSI